MTRHPDTARRIDIGIPEDQRDDIARGLARVLADTATLYFMTHAFHWNVTGPLFTSLHGLFEEQYTELWESLDELAERIRALGSYAPVSWAAIARDASIPEADGTPEALEMVRQLMEGHEALARTVRELLPQVESVKDESSADLLIRRLQVHEKTAWMLRSVLG